MIIKNVRKNIHPLKQKLNQLLINIVNLLILKKKKKYIIRYILIIIKKKLKEILLIKMSKLK